MKNYKAGEKDMLVEQVREALANGQDLSRMVFRGHGVKHHRILRHWRAKVRQGGSVPTCASMQLDETAKNRQRDALLSSVVDQPPRTLGEPTSAELILLSTRTYVQSFVAACKVTHRTSAHLAPSHAGSSPASGMLLHAQANQFWHDFETAVNLLRIGSTALGWSTFHTCWRVAADNFLSQPITLLRKVLTTLHPHGSLKGFPEVSHSALKFIADLTEIKFGASHPLVQVCLNVWRDTEGPRTAESTLILMSSLFEEHLGRHHHETFQTDIALISRHSQNRDFPAAERIVQRLVRNSESSPDRTAQLPKALRKLAHVLKNLGRYGEAIAIHQRILACPANAISKELRIYTKEDIAELQRLQGDLFMESTSLWEALSAAQEFFGRNQAPTLHIWDKFRASMIEQRRDRQQYTDG
ncbi:hypothetical protein ACHAPT_012674 [Fusarium lateritium]